MRMRRGKEREGEKKGEESKWLGKNRIFRGGGGTTRGCGQTSKEKKSSTPCYTINPITPSPQTISRSIHVL